jgi:hypothetical protein
MTAAEIIAAVLTAYAAAGLLFAVVFVAKGVNKLDEAAAESGWGFRLMIIPGVAAFWPVLLQRWLAR